MTFWDLSDTADFDYLDHVLEPMCRHARQCGVSMMVVGAASRDLLLRGGLGVDPLRMTKDVDIALAVDSWEQLAAVTAPLTPVRDVPHRFLVQGAEVDIVPFGALERPDRTIVWPNDHAMSVLGFSEAFAHADEVRLARSGSVRVPSLETQAVLKVMAWFDRHHRDSRDAEDLREILLAGHRGPHLDALYEPDGPELETFDWDPQTAGAARLGRLAAEQLDPSARAVVSDVLEAQTDPAALLLADMGRRVAENHALLHAFRSGFAGAS